MRKRPELRGRLSDFPKSLNELASLGQHFVFRFLYYYALQDSIMLQKILHPLKTSSCGMFSEPKEAGVDSRKSSQVLWWVIMS